MSPQNVRRAFQLFHVVLAASLLAMGLMDLRHNLSDLAEPGHMHLAFVATLQVLGAVLLMVPRTVWVGGIALLVVLIPSIVFELSHGDWDFERLVFAAGVWFVMAHGAAWAGPPGAHSSD